MTLQKKCKNCKQLIFFNELDGWRHFNSAGFYREIVVGGS